MSDVPVNDRTAVVRVDQIIEAPPALADYQGQEITVQISGRQKLAVGQQFIFHTISWIYGDSIAVQSLSQEPVKAEHRAMLSAAQDPVERKAERETRERFHSADVVVSGKVTAVRLPSEETSGATASARGAEQRGGGPVSEHDPKWREAVVEVDDVHKGEHAKKQIVVRFPASTDVMWYSAPKFHPGQQGYFMLHKTEVKTQPTKRGAKKGAQRGASTESAEAAPEAETKDVYTALDPADFQPYQQPGGIKTILENESAKEEG